MNCVGVHGSIDTLIRCRDMSEFLLNYYELNVCVLSDTSVTTNDYLRILEINVSGRITN